MGFAYIRQAITKTNPRAGKMKITNPVSTPSITIPNCQFVYFHVLFRYNITGFNEILLGMKQPDHLQKISDYPKNKFLLLLPTV